MFEVLTRIDIRNNVRKKVSDLVKDRDSVIIVHYSCESFNKIEDGRSARITSIAVRNLGSGQTKSFSIHLAAEEKKISFDLIQAKYDELEQEILSSFSRYVETNKNYKWLHWNMRDSNYGFPHLMHRGKILGVQIPEIHEKNLFDLAVINIEMFGPNYAQHPRLINLMKKNNISDLNMLSGAEEAKAFVSKEYVKLHLSTLRKVDVISNILMRNAEGKLMTESSWLDIYGSNLGGFIEKLKDSWMVFLLGLAGGVSSIIGLYLAYIQIK